MGGAGLVVLRASDVTRSVWFGYLTPEFRRQGHLMCSEDVTNWYCRLYIERDCYLANQREAIGLSPRFVLLNFNPNYQD